MKTPFKLILTKPFTMKKISNVLLIFCFVLGSNAQEKLSKNEKAQFEVFGNCGMCKKRIEKAALTVDGVKSADWDIPTKQLQLVYDAKEADILDIHKAIAAVGHDTNLVKADDTVYADLPMCCQYDRQE